AAGVEAAFGFAQIARLQPGHPGTARFDAGGPVLRRPGVFRLWQWQQGEAQTPRPRVDRHDMSHDADGLDILLFAETGGEDATKPSLAETAGVGPHPMPTSTTISGKAPRLSCVPSIAAGDSASLRRRHSLHEDELRVSAAIATRAAPSHHVPGRPIRSQARACAFVKSSRIATGEEA